MKKYALVTGAADRIGKSVALHLAKKGYSLLLHCNTSVVKAEKVQQEILALGQDAQILKINFLEDYDFDVLMSSLQQKNIQLEVLVNCASDFRPSGFQDFGVALLNREFTINFHKPYLLTKAYAKFYHKGNIINFLDTKITKNTTTHLDYLLSKKLLHEFTQMSALELAPGFRVNGIAPGLILPPADKDENYLQDLAQKIPLKTIGNLSEIHKAVDFILDSYFVTGQILYIDGGDHLT